MRPPCLTRGAPGTPREVAFRAAYTDPRLDKDSNGAFQGGVCAIAEEVSGIFNVNFGKDHVTQVRAGRKPGKVMVEGFAPNQRGPPPNPYGKQTSRAKRARPAQSTAKKKKKEKKDVAKPVKPVRLSRLLSSINDGPHARLLQDLQL
jgi:hypothetical protein